MTRSIQQLPNSQLTSNVVEIPTATGFNAGDAVYFKNGDYISPTVSPSNFANPLTSLNFNATATLPLQTNYFGGNSAITPIFSNSASSGGGYYGGSIVKNVAALIASYQASTGTSGQFTITVASNTGIANGQFVTGTGIGANATVTNISGTTITLSVANSGTVSSNVTFYSGNYVVAWIANTAITGGQAVNYPYYEIISSTGAQIVAPTQINGVYTNTSTSNIAVCALTGGGFAYYYVNTAGGTANKPCYGIISNTGTVVLSTVNDTSLSQTTSYAYVHAMASLPNGGFVLLSKNGSAVTYFKILTSTGGVTTAWTSSQVAGTAPQNAPAIAVRSTSEFIIWDNNGSTGTYYYSIITATGSFTATNLLFTSSYMATTTTGYPVDATCLSDGTTFLICYAGADGSSNPINAYVRIPAGNTISTELYIPYTNLNRPVSSYPNFINTTSTSNGGFVIAFTDTLNAIQYAFFNSTGVAISGTNSNGTLPISVSSTYVSVNNRITLLETATGVNFYWSPSAYSGRQSNTWTMSVSKSTYALTYSSTSSYAIGQVTSTNPSTLSLSNSTLTGFKYTLNTQETDSLTASLPTTATISPATLVSSSVIGSAMCTLTTGNICIAYVTSAYAVNVSIYTNAGVLVKNISVASGSTNAAYYFSNLHIVAMASGKFALMYPNTTNLGVTLNVYSSSFVQTATTTVTGNSFNQTYNICVASTAGDLLAVGVAAGNGSTYASAYVYSNSLSLIASYDGLSGTGAAGQNMSICGNEYGGFAITASNVVGTSSYKFASFLQISPTSWQIFNPSWTPLASATTGVLYGNQNLTYYGGGLYGVLQPQTSGTTAFYYQLFGDNAGIIASGAIASYNPGTSPTIAIGQNAYGSPVLLNTTTNANSLQFTVGTPQLFTGSGSISPGGYPVSLTQTFTTSIYGSSAPGTIPLISPVAGNYVAIAWLNSSGYLVFQIVSSFPTTYNYLVTTSQASVSYAPINPNPVASTSQIAGTMLVGVASTSASAGSTGQVIINGLAQLNSSYSTSTVQSFDFTGLPVDGARGFVNGRTVNLQGNS